MFVPNDISDFNITPNSLDRNTKLIKLCVTYPHFLIYQWWMWEGSCRLVSYYEWFISLVDFTAVASENALNTVPVIAPDNFGYTFSLLKCNVIAIDTVLSIYRLFHIHLFIDCNVYVPNFTSKLFLFMPLFKQVRINGLYKTCPFIPRVRPFRTVHFIKHIVDMYEYSLPCKTIFVQVRWISKSFPVMSLLMFNVILVWFISWDISKKEVKRNRRSIWLAPVIRVCSRHNNGIIIVLVIFIRKTSWIMSLKIVHYNPHDMDMYINTGSYLFSFLIVSGNNMVTYK